MIKHEDRTNIEYLTGLLKNTINDKNLTRKFLKSVFSEVEKLDNDFFVKFYNTEVRIIYYALRRIFDEFDLNINITNMFYMTGTKENVLNIGSLNAKILSYNSNECLYSDMLNNTHAPLFSMSLFILELEYKNKIYLFQIIKCEDILIILSINKYPFSLFYWLNDIDNIKSQSFQGIENIHDKILSEVMYSSLFQNYVSDNFSTIINNTYPKFEELSIVAPTDILYFKKRKYVTPVFNNDCNEIDIKDNNGIIKKIIFNIKKSYLIDNKTILFCFVPINKNINADNSSKQAHYKEMDDDTLMKKMFFRNIFIKKDSELYKLIDDNINNFIGYTSDYCENCDKKLDSLILKMKMNTDFSLYNFYFKVNIGELENEYYNKNWSDIS